MLLNIKTLALIVAYFVVGRQCQKFNCSNPTSYWIFRKCCDSPAYFDEDILNTCRDTHVTKKMSEYKSLVVGVSCMSECIFNKTNFYINGTINVDNINKTLTRHFHSPIWEPVLDTVLPICIKEVIEKEDELRENTENMFTSAGGPCDFMPILTFACLNLQIFRNCPVPFWVICKYAIFCAKPNYFLFLLTVSADRCAKVKTYDDRCSLIPGIPRRL